MRSLFVSVFLLIPAFISAPAHADGGYQTISIGGGFTVSDSETKSLPLGSVRRIKNLIVQAEGIRSDSVVEVMVNGEVKGTIYAPGRDPSYVVTVEETARSVEFRHRGGGAFRVIQVMATVSDWSRPDAGLGGGFNGDKDQVRQLAAAAMAQIEVLREFASPEDETAYLYPIKKNAGLVYVMSNAHGNLSKLTVTQLIALMDQIDFARAYLNTLMTREGAFEAVVDLLTVRETIADLTD